ncbi:rho GTPase-activating protein 10-like [Penaeus japonicus]|uniref:rho GTPase-activating protein 10-like n=1 Tax=Penaeus japonicus TaxID=27405 RepID=UPI001C710B78|nr:rho GTPase-activating protein 10-like [Penaeus japonicus]
MGLMPLEFKDCLTDSPYFREKLHTHEKELDQTNASIKALIKEVKDLIQAARSKFLEFAAAGLVTVSRRTNERERTNLRRSFVQPARTAAHTCSDPTFILFLR